MTTVLVTGGAGFIGSHVCKALHAAGITPVSFDNLSRGHADQVRWGPLVEGDVTSPSDLDAALEAYSPDAVMHFAAYAYVGESFEAPLLYYRNNVIGVIALTEAMKRHRIERLVFSSSCATYGIPTSDTIVEETPQRPINPYGASKLMGERVIRDVAASSRLRFALLRYFNAAGADASGTLPERHDPETHLIPLAIDAAIGRAPPLRVFGADYPTADGTCERDFIHVSDLAGAHLAALRRLENEAETIVNIGSGRATSVKEIIDVVGRVTKRPVPHVMAQRRPGDPPRLVAEIGRASRDLGYSPQHSAIETIVETAYAARR